MALVYELIMLAVGLVLTVGTGFFVASEFSLVNLDRSDLESRQERGERRLAVSIGALLPGRPVGAAGSSVVIAP